MDNFSSLVTEKIEDGSKQEWINNHCVAFLYNNALPSTVGSLLVSILLALALYFSIEPAYLYEWLIACVVVFIIRMGLIIGFRSENKVKSNLFWLNCFRSLNFVSGIIIGSSSWLFMPTATHYDTVLILCVIVGLVSGATPTYSVDKGSFLTFITPTCIIPIGYLAYLPHDGTASIVGMLVVYVIAMIRVAHQSRESLLSNFELSFALNYRATHDALTCMYNRQEFENQFQIKNSLTTHGVAMMFIDLDNFKLLNDSLGHQVGDKALQQVADAIRKNVREDDVCARLGGDEYVVLLHLDHASTVETIGNKIISDVNSLKFDDPNFPGLGCSVGIAFKENKEISYSTIMKKADDACYKSKAGGKNQITIEIIK